jgi:NADP-dependent 3-hydroxy acid dehydrogenase YdfG
MKFQNHTVMITGAAGHLGRAVAAHFSQLAAKLVLVDRQAASLEAAFGTRGEHALVAADLLDATQLRSTLAAAIERCGRVDVLCHLAGGFRMGEAVHETTDQTWNFLFDLNARTLVNIARGIVPHMLERGGGKIVNVGAFAAQKGTANMGTYCASKSSVMRLTEAMSAELKDRNMHAIAGAVRLGAAAPSVNRLSCLMQR